MTDHRRRERSRRKGPWRTELIEGESIEVKGREVVPLVRVTSGMRRQASLIGEVIEATGYGFVDMRPVAIRVKGEEGEERHSINDETARLIARWVAAAILVPAVTTLLIYLWRSWSSQRSLKGVRSRTPGHKGEERGRRRKRG